MKKKTLQKEPVNVVGSIVLLIGSLIMVFPFVWMVLSSFKTVGDVYTYPPKWLPSEWNFNNFQQVFDMIPFWTYYGNSIFTSVVQTVLQIAISILAAYALTKLRFPGRNAMYTFLQSSMFVPTVVTIIPTFLVVSWLGLVNSYGGIILPQIMSAFTTMLIMSFFVSVKAEQNQVGFGQVDRECTVRHNIDNQKTHLLSFNNQITNCFLAVLPQERFTATEEKDSYTHIVKLLHFGANLFIWMYNSGEVVYGTMLAF